MSGERNTSAGGEGDAKQADSAVADCVRLGLRLTPRRKAIAAIFDDLSEPIDVEGVWGRLSLHGERVNRISVYRILDDLQTAGVITQVATLGRRKMFERRQARSAVVLRSGGKTVATADAPPGLVRQIETLVRGLGFCPQGAVVIEVAVRSRI